jgi:hypothetical protein
MNAAGALGGVVCVLLIAIPIGLLIGAAILMGACALFNKMAGATATGREPPPPYNPYEEERPAVSPGSTGIQEQPDQGYGGIQDRPNRGYDDYPDPDRDLGIRRVVGVPQPDLLKAMGIVLVVGIVNFCVNSVIGMGLVGAPVGFAGRHRAEDPAAELLAGLVGIPVGFLIQAGLLTAMLPTTFGKAALVTLIHYLIIIAICVVLFTCLFGIGMAMRV